MLLEVFVMLFINGSGGASLTMNFDNLEACKAAAVAQVQRDPYSILSRSSCVNPQTGETHMYIIVPHTENPDTGMSDACWYVYRPEQHPLGSEMDEERAANLCAD